MRAEADISSGPDAQVFFFERPFFVLVGVPEGVSIPEEDGKAPSCGFTSMVSLSNTEAGALSDVPLISF